MEAFIIIVGWSLVLGGGCIFLVRRRREIARAADEAAVSGAAAALKAGRKAARKATGIATSYADRINKKASGE